MASETVGNDTVIAGTFSQRIHSCLATLDQLLGQSKPVVTSFILPEKKVEAKTSGGNNMMIDSLLNVLGEVYIIYFPIYYNNTYKKCIFHFIFLNIF